MQGKQQDLQRANTEDDRGKQTNTEQQVKQFMSLNVVGQEPGPQVKRPTSSRILAAQARPGASPAKNGTGSPVKLQRIKIMNQTTQGGFKLNIPQPPQAQAQQQSLQSIHADYSTQQQLASQAGSGRLAQAHQKPPTHGFNSVGGLAQAAPRMRSPHPDMQTAKQKEFNLTAASTTFATQSNQSGLHPPPSPGPQSNQMQVLATNHVGPKVKIQSSSLNRIQQQSNAHHGTLQSTRNQATASLATVGGASSASGSQLCRPLRAQTNNLITAGATIMANSPHRAEDTPTMPSITSGQQPSQNPRVLYRSTGRGDSCERTINNTLDSLAQVNKSDVKNFQNFQAMQMAIHNGGRRMRVAPVAQGLIRHSEKTKKERVSLPMIGQVNATQDSRTGILTKTKTEQQSIQYDRQSSRVSGDGQAMATTAGTAPATRRSSRDKLISRVSSRYTEIGDEEDYEVSDDESSGEDDDQVVTREARQRSAVEQFLLSEDSYLKGSTNATSPSNGDEAPHGVSLVQQLMLKEKEAKPVWTEQTPKVVGGKVPQLAQDANAAKPKKGQPFDFNFIKILIKRGNSDKDKKEVFLDRHWVQKNNNVPHFANVIKNVDGGEGVEITMNCNKAAFTWLMDFVRVKSNAADRIEKVLHDNGFITKLQRELIEDEMEQHLYVKMEEIDLENCLNILVTAYFLQLFWAYEKVWAFYFKRNFSDVVNACSISLSNINPVIVRHIAERIGEDEMEQLQERKDKFISNVYKEKINYHIHMEGGSAASKGTQAPPGLAELDDTERQLLRESKQLYWCARCKNLLTKEQATKISCVEPPALDDAGQPNCALGTAIFEFYKDRVNPLCLAPSDIFKSMLEEEQSRRESQKKKKKQQQDAPPENDDGFIDEEGLSLFHHDLVFEEDVPKIVDLMKKLPPDQKRPIKLSVPVDLAAFIKFFREKYRLCWKEIYLKIHALVYRPEQCKKCRKWFQISQMATCHCEYVFDPSDPLNSTFIPVCFHEIDHSEKELPMQNDLTLRQIQILKQEVQVLDNQKMYYKVTQRDLEKNKKGKNQIEVLVEQLHGQIEFIEPQSMNFDVKISDAYQDFLKREEKGKGQGKGGADNRVHNINEIHYTNGDRYDYVEDQIDDELYRSSKAQKRINKKLKDAKFMSKLQKECEHYVRENPDEFKRLEQPSKQVKLDIVDNKIVDMEQTKKKSKKEQLDSVQTAEVQQLVIKRFRRCKKDIIMEDDEEAMQGLQRALASVRQNEPREGPLRNTSGAGTRQRSSNPKGAPSSVQPGKNLLIVRNRSPQGHASQAKPEAHSSNCDFAAQAGVKIYSDIKQITVKKAASKKVPIIIKNQDGTRKNILQRNFARSSGARSGSNQHKGNSNSIVESPIIPVLNKGGQRNNSSNPKKHGSNSMVLVDDQKEGSAMQTPKNDPNQNPKMRSIQQNNSATRVQVKSTSFSMEGVTLKLPANNFINQSQEQLNTTDSHQASREKSLNQRRPLRSPGDQQTIKTMFASQQSLDRGAAHSGRGGQQIYAVAGAAYPAQMKLALPQGLHRSVVEINNPGHTATLSSLKHSQGPSRSGSQGGPTPTESATAANSSQPSLQPAAAANPAVRINKSPALKIRPSKIDKAQTLLKISQHKQNNQQS